MTKQRSFASLTEEEINQVAEWLQHGTYDEVRDRVAKPRPEGFGLNLKSKRPLETLWQNKNTVDKINQKLMQGEKLTLSEFNAINSGERADLPEKIHDIIMETTCELATSGENNPTRLLTLQRLADFPARAEYREHKRQLELRKEQRDIEKQTHKIAMDDHRKHLDNERLILAQRAQTFREQQLANNSAIHAPTASSPGSAIQEDALGRLARKRDDVERRTCERFNLPYHGPTKPESSAPPSPQTSSETLSEASSPTLSKSPELGVPSLDGPPLRITNHELQNSASSAHKAPSTASSVVNNESASLPSFPSVQNSAIRNPNSAIPEGPVSSESAPRVSPNSQSAICDLQSRVDAYTVRRAQEYWAYRRQYSDPPPPRRSHPAYITEYRHCPCGNARPCAVHENKETYGRFPDWFWSRSPHSLDYADCLRDRGLPYRDPTEFL